MPDVAKKVINANTQKNNRVVVFTPALRSGSSTTSIEAKDSGEHRGVDVAEHERALDTRFDDQDFYG
jgi:hypothetical protein